jgi:hypothetical protein
MLLHGVSTRSGDGCLLVCPADADVLKNGGTLRHKNALSSESAAIVTESAENLNCRKTAFPRDPAISYF